MKIIVECIHKADNSKFTIYTDNDFYSSNDIYFENVLSDYNDIACSNIITCRINSLFSDKRFRLPEDSVWLKDVLGFSRNMTVRTEYDCVLEMASFVQVDLFTNHNYSIRGFYWSNVPQKYLCKYQLYKNQECIEIDEEIILIAPYNNLLTNRINEGTLIEVIPRSDLNLKAVSIIR